MPRDAIAAAVAVLLWTQMLLAGPWHAVTGCVKDEKGAPIPGAVVRLKELEGGLNFALTADAKGCFRQESVPNGAYEVSAEYNGVAISRIQIVLDEKKKRDVPVDLLYRPLGKSAAAGAPAPPMINLKMLAWGNPSMGKSVSSTNSTNSLVKSVAFNVKWVDGGDPAMGHVSLVKPAPEGGVVVRLSVNNSALAEVPPEISINAGTVGGWFLIKTSRLRGPSDVRLQVSASDGGGTASSDLIIGSYTRLTVTLQGCGSGRVISAPGGIVCSMGTCPHPFRDGETVKLLPQPLPGSVFNGWSGDCSQDGMVVVSHPTTCTAVFSRQQP